MITKLALAEVLLLSPKVFGDSRGYFKEIHSDARFLAENPGVRFVQDNVSFSRRATLRGLHLQHPYAQGKLVMALTGAIQDVAVDVRIGSPTFGQWVSEELSDENHRELYIPPGFAHGFCVLSETAHVLYKCSEGYHPEGELSIRYDDPAIGIAWPFPEPLLSEKDRAASVLSEIPLERLPRYGQ